MVKTAVIMAAGMGTRFGNRTELIPKGFVPAGGIPMVIRSIDTLKACGIERIIIGTGYHKEFYEELSQYAQSRGYAVEDYIKKAVKEKLDSDRISSMIDVMSFKR